MFTRLLAALAALCLVALIVLQAFALFFPAAVDPWALVAGLALVMALTWGLALAPWLRKVGVLALAACVAASLSACGTITPLFSAPPGASPETQAALSKAKADADAAFVKALTDKLAHCSLTGSISIGIGGIAATGTGFANTAQLTCPGEAYGTNDFVAGITTLSGKPVAQ